MQGNDPCYQVKELVCPYLAVEALKSARLSSREWCNAASSAVATACIRLSSRDRGSVEKELKAMLQAFPCCTQIFMPFDVSEGTTWSQGPFLLLTAVEAAGSLPEPDGGWRHKQWNMVVKPYGPDVYISRNSLRSISGDPLVRSMVKQATRTLPCKPWGVLSHRNNPMHDLVLMDYLGSYRAESAGLVCLHSGLQHPVHMGDNGGFMGWGRFDSLRELYLHSTGGEAIRIQSFDLQLPSLQHLQLSGNIRLDVGWPGPPYSYGLQSSQLTSITLQQVLAVEEAAVLCDTKPHLQHLAVLAPAPDSPTPWQDLKFVSSTKSIEVLRGLLDLVADGAGQQLALFDAHTLTERQAKMVVDFALTPYGLQTPESLAEAILRHGAARHAAVSIADALRAAAPLPAQCAALEVSPLDNPAAAGVAEDQHQSGGTGADAGVQGVSMRKISRPLQHLAVQSGCWVDLHGLLQQWTPEKLTVSTLPAVTDALQHGEQHSSCLDIYWFQVAVAFFAGATPSALRMQLPAGLNLRVLEIDTTRTCAGIEVDDRALLTISSSCRQLQTLHIKALLRVTDNGGSALQSLQALQQLQLWDLRWNSVFFLLQLAADAPWDDRRALRRYMSTCLQRIYYAVSIGGFAIAAALRRHKVLRAAALLGMAALALPATATCSGMLIPLQEWQAARLCAAAARRAGQPAFAVRPCWLPASLQRLQLHDCVLRCHKHCRACRSSCTQQQCNHLRVEVLPAQEGPPISTPRRDLLLGERQRVDKAAFWQVIREGGRDGWLPSLPGLVGQVLLAPCVPFAVTLAGKVGLSWLLKNHGGQLQGLLAHLAGSRSKRRGAKGLSPEQPLAMAAAVRMGV